MAISKIIYKTSPQDTGTVWMDATPATAAAADILAPKTAMLADGVMTTGTGSGGGGGGLTLLATDEVTVSTTSTSSTTIKSLNLLGITATDKLFLVFIYDKAGPRNGYFYSSAVVFANMFAKNGISGATSSVGKIIYSLGSGGAWTTTANNYGVFANEYSYAGALNINARYGSSYGTIDGTYAIEVYQIDIDPFS